MVNEESLRMTDYLIRRAYSCACGHGFHVDALSVEHLLMLVLSEVGEAVEADRNGRYAELDKFREWQAVEADFANNFRTHIKDSVGDELADVCIRLYDLCGAFGIVPRVEYDSMEVDFQDIFGEDSFCERMYYLSRLLCSTSGVVGDDGTDECLPQVVGQCLSFLFALSKDMGIDLMQHIEWKMQYNESRPYKNGKKY